MPPVLSMPKPICLIENTDGNTLVLNQEAEKILSEISQPVVVIAIVGKYRTGKSYLMNKLAGRNTGFALGSTIQSETKGIWMWCVPHPQNSSQTLVLLDTEGLGDVGKGDSKNDAWIFSLAILLSSAFVFNSLGTIDQQSMEQLHYVTELTKLIKLKSSGQEDEDLEYKRIFPSFTWCVRDFTLMLKKDGESITEDEYLLSSLAAKKGEEKHIQDYNLPRDCILRFFHTHKCFVFERPASGKKLWILEELQESELDEDFVEQARKFYNYMITNSSVKTLSGGIKVTGKMLAVLTASYVKAIQSGTVPCMENAVLALAEIENTGALQDALSKYEFEMDKHVRRFPTERQQEFLKMHIECEKEAIKVFLGRSLNDKDQKFQRNLKEQIEKRMNEYSTKNEEASRVFCRKLLRELSVTMEKNIKEGKYMAPGGHKKYVLEGRKVTEAYYNKPGKGMKALEVMQEYVSEKKDIETTIIQADETLTKKEKQLAEEQAKAQNEERKRQIIEQNARAMEQRMKDQERSFEHHKEMLIQKMENDRKVAQMENEVVRNRLLQEQEMRLRTEFDKRTSNLERKNLELQEKVCSEQMRLKTEYDNKARNLERKNLELQEKDRSEQMRLKTEYDNKARNLERKNLEEQMRLKTEYDNRARNLERKMWELENKNNGCTVM